MDFALLVVVQMVVTVFITIFINRKLLLQNVALRNQLGVYLRTVDKSKIKSQIRDRDRDCGSFSKSFFTTGRTISLLSNQKRSLIGKDVDLLGFGEGKRSRRGG